MRVLILNGSPRKQGNTAQMVKTFCEGRAAAGHEYDVLTGFGLTTEERIKKTTAITMIALFIPMLILVLYMVYGINGVSEF